MPKIYTVSHKSPDTDSVLGTIILADYLNNKGYEAIPIKLGELNNETIFILDRFGVEVPETRTELEKGSLIALADHNEATQSIDNREKYQIEWVVDHHKFANFETAGPLNMRVEKLCSTCSVLYKMFKEAGFEITETTANLMMSGIISDSLYFRSPTTTKEDTIIFEELNKIAKIDVPEGYAMEMFGAKSNLGDISTKDLIMYDYKEFELGAKKAGIGVLETTAPGFAMERKEKILKEIENIKNENNLDFLLYSIIDIIQEKNITIAVGELEEKIIKEVFEAELIDGEADLGRIISRKKQMAPDLVDYFNK